MSGVIIRHDPWWLSTAPQPIAVTKWVWCAVHDHCQVEVDLNEGRGVRWCDGATWDGLPCDLRALTAGGRA